jgi:hypothetical protein
MSDLSYKHYVKIIEMESIVANSETGGASGPARLAPLVCEPGVTAGYCAVRSTTAWMPTPLVLYRPVVITV